MGWLRCDGRVNVPPNQADMDVQGQQEGLLIRSEEVYTAEKETRSYARTGELFICCTVKHTLDIQCGKKKYIYI